MKKVILENKKEALNKTDVSVSWKEIEESAEKWFNDMTQEEWNDIERKHGYYGHDIGSTKEDIVNMYKAEFNIPIRHNERVV